MSARADYNLRQAVAMINFIAEQWHKHLCVAHCSQCAYASMYDDDDYCEYGLQLVRNRTKWKRRCKYAARREGVVITV